MLTYLLRATVALDAPPDLRGALHVLEDALQDLDPQRAVTRLGEGNTWDWTGASLEREQSEAHSRAQAQRYYERAEVLQGPAVILTLRGTLPDLRDLTRALRGLGAGDAINGWVSRTPEAAPLPSTPTLQGAP